MEYILKLVQQMHSPVVKEMEYGHIKDLPAPDVHILQTFNNALTDETVFCEVSEIYAVVGGKDHTDTTRKLLTRIISHELSLTMNWSGRNDRVSFKDFKNIVRLITDRRLPITKFGKIKIRDELAKITHEMYIMKREMKQQYKSINTKLDKIYHLMAQNWSQTNYIDLNTTQNEDLLDKFKFPLSSCEEIFKLDEEIRHNPEFKAQLVTAMSKIGGTSGEEDGGKIAYKLIDYLFRSDVLINYSWTGVSRGKSSEKLSFQTLEGILSVIFDVLLLADNRHTKQKNASIFRDCVLKHAKKRSLRKRAQYNRNTSGNEIECTDSNLEIPEEALKHYETDGESEVQSFL